MVNDAVAVERQLGGNTWIGAIGFDHNCISCGQYLPVRIGCAQRRGNGIAGENCPIMKTDTAAQLKAPTLISRFSLPGCGQAGLRLAAVIERDERLENQARKADWT